MKKTAGVVILAVAFCFILASVAQAGPCDPICQAWAKKNLKNKNKAVSIPVWQITQDGTAKSVKWVDALNERFAIYDTNGDNTTDPATWVDDVVLDKETGLIWERSPSTTDCDWIGAFWGAYQKYLGGRMGWRVPTIEELTSLMDPNTADFLPQCHPFVNADNIYWSSNTMRNDTTSAWSLNFAMGALNNHSKSQPLRLWCVRGGQGHDAY